MDKLIDVDEIRAICEDEVFERYLFKDVCPWEAEYYESDKSKAWYSPELIETGNERGNLVPCEGVEMETRLARNKWLSGMANRELAYRRMLLTVGKNAKLHDKGVVSPWGVMSMAIAKSTWDSMIYSDQSKLVSHSQLLGPKVGAVGSQRFSNERTLSDMLKEMTDENIVRRLHNQTAPNFKTRFKQLYYLRAEGRYEFVVTQLANALTRLVLNINVNRDTTNVQTTLHTWCGILDHSYTSFSRTMDVVNDTLPVGDKLELDFDEDKIRGSVADLVWQDKNLVQLFNPSN